MASPKQGKTRRKAGAKRAAASTRPALSREFIAEHKKRRIMDALAELCVEKGYEATKISDIVRRAKVARKTLYDNFDGKEEVFLATFDAARDDALGRVEEGCAAAGEQWRDRVEAGLGAFLGWVAEEPVLAQMCMIEALSATPATTKRYEDAQQAFIELAGRSMPEGDFPDTVDEQLVGGIASIVYKRLRAGEAEQVEELLPELTEFMLAPYTAVS